MKVKAKALSPFSAALPLAAALALAAALPPGPRGAQGQHPAPVQGAQGVARASVPVCAPSLTDAATGGCLLASSQPALGRLYPLSADLFVEAGTGRVGLGTTAPASRLHVDGTTTTRVLTITGGADLVESFDAGEAPCAPGTVLVIDPARPGALAPSARAYDRRVAGVVSGAGGLSAGIRLGREGAADGSSPLPSPGATPVAMTGRVYVRCTTENGAIEPGDLLTTASANGRAMRASDPERSFGAVLGKAMTPLVAGPDGGTGEGLVLVLVGLQ